MTRAYIVCGGPAAGKTTYGKKLAEKNLDLIVGNIVGKEGSGFASDSNQVVLYRRGKPPEPLEPMEKEAVAHAVLDRVVGLIRGES